MDDSELTILVVIVAVILWIFIDARWIKKHYRASNNASKRATSDNIAGQRRKDIRLDGVSRATEPTNEDVERLRAKTVTELNKTKHRLLKAAIRKDIESTLFKVYPQLKNAHHFYNPAELEMAIQRVAREVELSARPFEGEEISAEQLQRAIQETVKEMSSEYRQASRFTKQPEMTDEQAMAQLIKEGSTLSTEEYDKLVEACARDIEKRLIDRITYPEKGKAYLGPAIDEIGQDLYYELRQTDFYKVFLDQLSFVVVRAAMSVKKKYEVE